MKIFQFFLFFVFLMTSSRSFAETAVSKADLMFWVGNLWILISACLVFLMHLGFATLEAGLTQSKNTINILFKNVTVVSIGFLAYLMFGFSLMYPGSEFAGQVFGFSGFGLNVPENIVGMEYNTNYTFWSDFFFQAMFAATAATIVSGAVAERMKFESFLIFSSLLVGLCYPIIGMWKWGGGFLDTLSTPFYDFAGSTLVHSVGGWAALLGAIMVGARRGRYVDGKINIIPPHSLPLATIGVFILWFGWFGFNGGSVLSANPEVISRVLVVTMIAAAAGSMGALIASKVILGNFDLSMTLNGILAGLVGITAGADLMSAFEAIVIGFLAGTIVVNSVLLLDRFKVDDPVGAISVHLVCGVWGTLAVGLFGEKAGFSQLISQLIGVSTVGVTVVVFSSVVLTVLKKTIHLRVGSNVEIGGLDLHEHGLTAYRGLSSDEEIEDLAQGQLASQS